MYVHTYVTKLSVLLCSALVCMLVVCMYYLLYYTLLYLLSTYTTLTMFSTLLHPNPNETIWDNKIKINHIFHRLVYIYIYFTQKLKWHDHDTLHVVS